MLKWSLLLAWACQGPANNDTSREDTSPETGSDTELPDSDSGDEDRGDEALLRALIAGEGDPEQVLRAIAWSGGLPVRGASGAWLFVTQADAEWRLAGDFNDWSPMEMSRSGDLLWAEVEVPDPAGAGYKFVAGDTWRADPLARHYDYDANGAISYVTAPARAHLQRWPALEGRGLVPRDVNVWVPAGEGPWPVLYAHDGQNLFDPAALGGGWRLREAVAGLDRPILVVGVDHGGVDRIDEYAHTTDVYGGEPIGGKGDALRDLLDLDLRPHIEATYGSTGFDGLIGSSMGGLSSLHIALDRPGRFDFVASMSGSLWFGRLGASNPSMQELWSAAPPSGVIVYADSGGDSGGDGCTDPDGDGLFEDDPNDSDGYCVTRAFVDALAEGGFTWGEDLHHWHEPGAPHSEAAWAARVHRPLEIFAAAAP